jgi:hypothetical protein
MTDAHAILVQHELTIKDLKENIFYLSKSSFSEVT